MSALEITLTHHTESTEFMEVPDEIFTPVARPDYSNVRNYTFAYWFSIHLSSLTLAILIPPTIPAHPLNIHLVNHIHDEHERRRNY